MQSKKSPFSENGWTVTEGQCFAIDSTEIPGIPTAHLADHTCGGETVKIYGSVNLNFGQKAAKAGDIVSSMDLLFNQIGNILPGGEVILLDQLVEIRVYEILLGEVIIVFSCYLAVL